jgi:hypothetical protein
MATRTFTEAGHHEQALFDTQTIEVVYEANLQTGLPYTPLKSDSYYQRSTGSYLCPNHALPYTLPVSGFYGNFESYLEQHLGYSRHPVSGSYGYWREV